MKAWAISNQTSLMPFLPEMVLLGGGLLILLLSSFFSKTSRSMYFGLGWIALFAFLFLSLSQKQGPETLTLFSGTLIVDSFSTFFRGFFGIVSAITLYFMLRSKDVEDFPPAESISILLVLTASMVLMASSSDLLMILLSLEMVSILSYIMVGFRRHHRLSSEAGLKYIIYGGVSSGIMAFGLSYIYGFVGSTSLAEIAIYFGNLRGISDAPAVFFALLAIMVGFGFKIATFPTQMWCPDVYQGAAMPVTAFLSIGPKAAGFAMTIRFFYTAFGISEGRGTDLLSFMQWQEFTAILAAATMTVGNLAALWQKNLKRLMAYSSIAHAGFLLMGFSAFTSAGIEAVLAYLIVYLLMNFGAFWILQVISNELGTEEIDGYRGLGKRAPVLSALLTVFLFSLVGLPPFAGFIGKFLIFSAVLKQNMYLLATVAVVNTVVSLVYYLKIAKTMYFDGPLESAPISMPRFSSAFAWFMAIPTLILGLYWTPILSIARTSIQSLF